MPLPNNFSSSPKEEPHRFFRNICIEFRKTIKTSKDTDKLQEEMERFLNTSKDMNWHHHNGAVYRKDEGEKACDKVWKEFDRYFKALQSQAFKANPQDLLEALGEVERLIHSLKVS